MKKKTIAIITLTALLCIVVVLGSLFIAGHADWLTHCFYHPDKTDNPEATAVSFAELEEWLENYSTLDYPADYGCEEYALTLHDAAEADGIRAAIVLIRVGSGFEPFHAINAFSTTDEGIIYVDSALGWDLGKCAIAELIDSVYVARVAEDTYIKTQWLGYEKDFLIFW